MSHEAMTIETLGAKGDGIAQTPQGSIYVPFALPGETVVVAREKQRGRLLDISSPSPARVTPPCPHFGPDGKNGACGGCDLQHMADDAYREWKRERVVACLAAEGIDAAVAPLFVVGENARRRMLLTARRTEKAMLVGFNQAGSHHVVAMDTCHVGAREIVAHLATIRRVAAAVCATSKPFRLTVLASETGLDIAAEGAGRLTERQRQAAIAQVLGASVVARLSVDGEVLVEARKPLVTFGESPVVPAPGGFVQASAAAETHMADLVAGHLAGSKRALDLFSGCGAFALRLARNMTVHAVETDAAQLAALDRGFRATPGLRRVTHERRDLFRRPVMRAETKPFDAAVFDPPRAGAAAQAAELAGSAVKRIAAVSCNPATLARDLKTLTENGYRIERVYPVDQFVWSPHVEAVALLTKV